MTGDGVFRITFRARRFRVLRWPTQTTTWEKRTTWAEACAMRAVLIQDGATVLAFECVA